MTKKDYNYPAIRAWGKKLGSYQYYVEQEVARATRDNAPQDAIYKRENDTWARIQDIKDLDKRADMYIFLDLQEQLSL